MGASCVLVKAQGQRPQPGAEQPGLGAKGVAQLFLMTRWSLSGFHKWLKNRGGRKAATSPSCCFGYTERSVMNQ